MREEEHPAVYILAIRYRGTLYIGVISSLWQRVWDHKYSRLEGFTKKYEVKTLVWYEHRQTMEDAIRRELHEDIDVTATLVAPKAGPPLARG
jgi:putative endonuclease